MDFLCCPFFKSNGETAAILMKTDGGGECLVFWEMGFVLKNPGFFDFSMFKRNGETAAILMKTEGGGVFGGVPTLPYYTYYTYLTYPP